MFGLFSRKVVRALPFDEVDETLIKACKRVINSSVPSEPAPTQMVALNESLNKEIVCFVEDELSEQVQDIVSGLQQTVGGVVVLHREDRLYAEINRYLAGFAVDRRHHHITAANASSVLYRSLVSLWRHRRVQENPTFFFDSVQQRLDLLQGQASVVVICGMTRDERQQLITQRKSLIWKAGDAFSNKGKTTVFDKTKPLQEQAFKAGLVLLS